jgi:hypothetical protein
MGRPASDRSLNQYANAVSVQGTRVGQFKPNPGGQELFMSSRKHIIILSGGNDSGKTYCGIMRAAHHLLPEKDKLGKPTGFTIHPYLRIRVPRDGIEGWISSYSDKVQHSNIKAVYDKILAPFETNKKVEGGTRHWAEFESGRILFKWQTRGVAGYQGDKVNFAHLDEPHKPIIYNETVMRLPDKGGYMWNTATFVMDESYTELDMAHVMYMQEKIQNWMEDKDRYPELDVIFLPMEENKEYNNYELAVDLAAGMSETERATRLYGTIVTHFGQCCFDRDKLAVVAEYLRQHPEVAQPQYGYLIYDLDEKQEEWRVVFDEGPSFFPPKPKGEWVLKIWQHPISKDSPLTQPRYHIGADCAEGSRGGDYTAVSVIREDTGEEVAALHGHISEIQLAQELYKLGTYYAGPDGKRAMLAIETNGIGKAVNSYLVNGHIDPNSNLRIQPYGLDRLYHRPPPNNMERGVHIVGNIPGWYTSSRTRDFLLTNMRRALLQAYEGIANPNPATGQFSTIKDAGQIEEARWFVLNKNGKYEGKAGVSHDDRLFARAIAEECRKQYGQRRGALLGGHEQLISEDRYLLQPDGSVRINDAVMFKRPERTITINI